MRIFAIAQNTFIEVVRQPIYIIILLCAIGLILLSPYSTMFALLDNSKLLKDMGLANILLVGLLISAFSASSVIYREIENRTILTVLSKPIERSSFVVGKFVGILGGILAAQYILTLILTQVLRTEITEAAYSKSDYPVMIGFIVAVIMTLSLGAFANFFYDRPFTSSAITFALPIFTIVFLALCFVSYDWKLQAFGKKLDLSIATAAFFIFLATSVLAAIAVAASTRLSPLPTIGICVFFFMLGLLSDYILGRRAPTSNIASFFYNIVPNLQVYWLVDAILEKRSIPFKYFMLVLAYTVTLLTGIISLAISLFERRETN